MEKKEAVQTIVAIAIIQNKKGGYLLIQSAKDFGEHTGKWYPPGGHLETGENIISCLRRELKEELNLEINPQKEIAITAGDVEGQATHWWACNIAGGSFKKDKSLSDVGFFPSEEIRKMNLWPATRNFFEEYIWKENIPKK